LKKERGTNLHQRKRGLKKKNKWVSTNNGAKGLSILTHWNQKEKIKITNLKRGSEKKVPLADGRAGKLSCNYEEG